MDSNFHLQETAHLRSTRQKRRVASNIAISSKHSKPRFTRHWSSPSDGHILKERTSSKPYDKGPSFSFLFPCRYPGWMPLLYVTDQLTIPSRTRTGQSILPLLEKEALLLHKDAWDQVLDTSLETCILVENEYSTKAKHWNTLSVKTSPCCIEVNCMTGCAFVLQNYT